MVIFILYSIYITIFLIIIFFVALILQTKWVYDFIFKNKTRVYENKPVEINIMLYKKSLRNISVMYVIADISNFLVFGKTPFLYPLLFIATLAEISVADAYRIYQKLNGKIFANREGYKIFVHKMRRISLLIVIIYLVVSLPLVGYFIFVSLNM